MQENNFVVSLDSPVMRWIKQPSVLVSVTERDFYVRNMETIETEMQVVHFEKICRLCLREEGSLTQIFDSNPKDVCSSIDRKIMACSSIEVFQNDGLPTQICDECLSRVNAAFDFRIQCENADKTLHDIISLVHSPNKTQNKSTEHCAIKSKLNTNWDNAKLMVEDGSQVIVIRNEELKIPNSDNVTGTFYVINEVDCVKETYQEENVDSSFREDTNDEGSAHNVDSYHPKPLPDKMSESNVFSTNEITYGGESDAEESQRVTTFCPKTNEGSILDGSKKKHCPYCNKKLARVEEHSHQLNCYDIKKGFKCSRCFKEFHRKSNFKAHILRHSDKREFKCQLCEHAFVDSTGLKRHFLKHHEPEQEMFVGGCCGKTFKSKEGLKKHIRKSICGIQIFKIVESN
ncbi:hypothetical protein RUM43_003822 [Polyplax serrata]|uniref:Uncharacterized protein n=1 Tax=Polyplax serrata TaxID=468196 RepID=A0AAN8P3E6_POLSC